MTCLFAQFGFFNACDLQKVPQESYLQWLIAMDWHRNSFYPAFLDIDVMAASYAGWLPAVLFEHARKFPFRIAPSYGDFHDLVIFF